MTPPVQCTDSVATCEQAWFSVAEHYEPAAPPSRCSESALRQELIFCLLGGHGVTFELARSATDVVLALDPFDPSWATEPLCATVLDELAAQKFDPRRADGSLRRYRYPARKAVLVSAAIGWYHEQGELGGKLEAIEKEHERRVWLCGCPGIGPKSASWFLRNTGHAAQLAILDVHILRALKAAERIGEVHLPRDYDEVEARFQSWCQELGASVAGFDLFLWRWQRGDIGAVVATAETA